MTRDAAALAQAYFDAWQNRDFETYRSLLADDVSFSGPMGEARGAEACTQGIRGMSEMVTRIVVHKIWGDGDDAITWFDLYTKDAGPLPTANWCHAEHGRIKRIRVAFDPRPLLAKGRASS